MMVRAPLWTRTALGGGGGDGSDGSGGGKVGGPAPAHAGQRGR